MPLHLPTPKSFLLTSLLAAGLVTTGCAESDPMNDDSGDETEGGEVDTGATSSEDGGEVEARTFTVRIENRSPEMAFLQSGVTAIPADASEPGPLLPGGSYEIDFYAGPGHHLSFAHMFVPSNDLFYAPDTYGIPLYEADGSPRSGDVTAEVLLWDAGSEVNEEPGAGPNQALNQEGPNTGDADDDGTVRLAEDTFGNLPAVEDVLAAELISHGDSRFTLRLTTRSTDDTLMSSAGNSAVPLAPGVWAVHTAHEAPIFFSGEIDRGDGLEVLAEDGDPSLLAGVLEEMTGLSGPLSPGAWAVHGNSPTLFEDGSADFGQGLEALAEDGDPSALVASLEAAGLSAGAFNTPEGADEAAPAFAGEAYSFTVDARPGDRLSVATMLVQSNDLFFAPDGVGFPLFDSSGEPIEGDVSVLFELWDAGTELNQFPGAGLDQAPRQAGPNTGAAEDGAVRRVDDAWAYPETAEYLRVSLSVE